MRQFEISAVMIDGKNRSVTISVPEDLPSQHLDSFVAKALMETANIGLVKKDGDEISIILPHNIFSIKAQVPRIDIISPSSIIKGK